MGRIQSPLDLVYCGRHYKFHFGLVSKRSKLILVELSVFCVSTGVLYGNHTTNDTEGIVKKRDWRSSNGAFSKHDIRCLSFRLAMRFGTRILGLFLLTDVACLLAVNASLSLAQIVEGVLLFLAVVVVVAFTLQSVQCITNTYFYSQNQPISLPLLFMLIISAVPFTFLGSLFLHEMTTLRGFDIPLVGTIGIYVSLIATSYRSLMASERGRAFDCVVAKIAKVIVPLGLVVGIALPIATRQLQPRKFILWIVAYGLVPALALCQGIGLLLLPHLGQYWTRPPLSGKRRRRVLRLLFGYLLFGAPWLFFLMLYTEKGNRLDDDVVLLGGLFQLPGLILVGILGNKVHLAITLGLFGGLAFLGLILSLS